MRFARQEILQPEATEKAMEEIDTTLGCEEAYTERDGQFAGAAGHDPKANETVVLETRPPTG